MERKNRKDLAVFMGLSMTLTLCALSFILSADIQRFENKNYSDITTGTIVIYDLISPGELEYYYEYKRELEFRIFRMNLCINLSLLSLAFTVTIILSGTSWTRPPGQDWPRRVRSDDV